MKEQWKVVKGVVNEHMVSNLGCVMKTREPGNSKNGIIIKQRTGREGYATVHLHGENRFTMPVCLLVIYAFTGEEPIVSDVVHKNGDMCDCRLNNLEWVISGESLKPVPAYSRYMVSDAGRVMSMVGVNSGLTSGHIMTPSNNGDGYGQVGLSGDDGQKFFLVHRLVMLAFVGEHPENPHVNHISGDTLDNHLLNLEWVTRSRNSQHAFEIGLSGNFGENHYRAKLTYDDVTEIRRRLFLGETNSAIARDFGVTPGAISQIRTGITWRRPQRTVIRKSVIHRSFDANTHFQSARISRRCASSPKRTVNLSGRIAA